MTHERKIAFDYTISIELFNQHRHLNHGLISILSNDFFNMVTTVESYHQFENNTIHGTLIEASLFLTYSISCSGLMVHFLYEVVTVFDSNSKYCDILLS